ncbi:MAG: DNA-processing protein DprA, partial [Gemmatimonadota bacterium]|nr:DNA-processing protein DprA [Gemmatimonadota bacterium]
MNTLRDMLRLMLVPGLGAVQLNRLIEAFGKPQAALDADFEELSQIRGIRQGALSFLAGRRWNDPEVERQLEVIERVGARPLYRWDEQYPPYLNQLYDAPPLLFVRGESGHLSRPCLAIVGTRAPSLSGLEMARKLACALASAGYTIVSGLARGVDSTAHKAALDAGGPTVAVLGCGVDIIYPAENKDLAQKIIERGTIVSDYPMGTPPEAKNFPRRNRIISGLSLGVLVVEAGKKSGALITAEYAADQNREVFAVPGDPARGLSHGTNRLIQRGAKLVTRVEDVLDELGGAPVAHRAETDQAQKQHEIEPVLSREERQVFDTLSSEPRHVDE